MFGEAAGSHHGDCLEVSESQRGFLWTATTNQAPKNNCTSFSTALTAGVFRGGDQMCVTMKTPDPEQDKQIRRCMDGWFPHKTVSSRLSLELIWITWTHAFLYWNQNKSCFFSRTETFFHSTSVQRPACSPEGHHQGALVSKPSAAGGN